MSNVLPVSESERRQISSSSRESSLDNLRSSLEDSVPAAIERDRTEEREHLERAKWHEGQTVRQTVKTSLDQIQNSEGYEDPEVREQRELARTELEPAHEVEQHQPKKSKGEIAAPDYWPKTSKEAWNNLPSNVKKAMVKRDNELENTWNEVTHYLKEYNDIHNISNTYSDYLNHFNLTPAQAYERCLQWVHAFINIPDKAFPAIMKSHGYTLDRLHRACGITVAKVLAGFGIREDDLYAFCQWRDQQRQQNPYLRQQDENLKLQAQLEDHQEFLNQLQQQTNANQQNENTRRMEGYFSEFAKTHPYFPHVRIMMGQLLTPDPQTGQALVPLKDGKVDLDTAYYYGCMMTPEVAPHFTADITNRQQEIENAKARQDEENRRKIDLGRAQLRSGSPGRMPPPNKGKSVRETIMASFDAHMG